MTAEKFVPPITEPLGKHWKQPDRKEILMDETHCLMSGQTFYSLPEYSATRPSGVYPGKMWRRHDGAFDCAYLASGGKPEWMLCWFGECDDPKMCSNHSRKILLLDEPSRALPSREGASE